jgi:hypothetical protein
MPMLRKPRARKLLKYTTVFQEGNFKRGGN